MNQVLNQCPVCSGHVYITKLKCSHCQTEVSGKFEMPLDKFGLEEELLNFLKVFIFAEGSIKQSEKLLNCSYPKIKNLLKKTKAALGIEEFPSENLSVIDRLDKGEIDVDEALSVLNSKNV